MNKRREKDKKGQKQKRLKGAKRGKKGRKPAIRTKAKRQSGASNGLVRVIHTTTLDAVNAKARHLCPLPFLIFLAVSQFFG
jgi:hypothetical protein